MKKTFIFFLVIIIFAISIFFIGFGTIRVKPGEFGVVVSKTNGVDEEPIMNGKFDWHWQFIIPGNTKIEKFLISPVNITKTVSGELPSGSLYLALFNAGGKFDYKFTFSISLTVTPDMVVQLLKDNVISNNNDLNEYLSMVADSIAQLASSYYLKKAYDSPAFRPEFVRRGEIVRNIRLDEEFPYVDLSVFALTECVIPDYTLYKELQNQGIIVVKDFKTEIEKVTPGTNKSGENKSNNNSDLENVNLKNGDKNK